jgi:hypothetical protein
VEEASRAALPDSSIVVRGGKSSLDAMKDSVKRTKRKQRLREQEEEALLSVFTHPADDAARIVERAPILRNWTKVQLSTAGRIRAAGFPISLPDERGHASVKLPDDPSDEDYERFRAAFDTAIPTPGVVRD